ncbi:MAG: hypothetical protein IJ087_01030 [Eggerthellaceae bacterium]|nr:hypothetical protein [Eggerthellaceae bacterium]
MARSDYSLDISLPEKGRVQALRLIIKYEAGVRGLTLNQALLQLVREAIDIDSYPPEIRDHLAEIREKSHERAVADAIGIAKTQRSA